LPMPRNASNDPYTYPGTHILRNKLGIRDEARLREFEYEQSASRIEELRENPVSGKFDLTHLKKIHQHIFQDVYHWAGVPRTVSISKDGDTFAVPAFVESQARRLGVALNEEHHLRGLEKTQLLSVWRTITRNGMPCIRSVKAMDVRCANFLPNLPVKRGICSIKTRLKPTRINGIRHLDRGFMAIWNH